MVSDALDALDEHKDEITALFGMGTILLRSIAVPNEMWVEMVKDGHLIWMVLAAGFGVGLSRLGRGMKRKLESNSAAS